MASSEAACICFTYQDHEQIAEVADFENPGSRQWDGLAVCRACREEVVAVEPSAIAEQLAGCLGRLPRWAFPRAEGALLEVQLRPGWGFEHSVGIVHGVSDTSPSDLGCGAAANPAKHVSQEHSRRRCRDCGVATAVSRLQC